MKNPLFLLVVLLFNVEVKAQDSLIFNGHAYVDLGLTSGTLWATCNIGADSPEESGDYFAWGETIGYNDGKTNYSWDTYKYCNVIYSTRNITKYNAEDKKRSLELEDDAAFVHWGAGCSIPSLQQWNELSRECICVYTTINGVAGMKATSMKNNNYIFFPAAGYLRDESKHTDDGCFYWLNEIYKTQYGAGYGFTCWAAFRGTDNEGRYVGKTIRPVFSIDNYETSVRDIKRHVVDSNTYYNINGMKISKAPIIIVRDQNGGSKKVLNTEK